MFWSHTFFSGAASAASLGGSSLGGPQRNSVPQSSGQFRRSSNLRVAPRDREIILRARGGGEASVPYCPT